MTWNGGRVVKKHETMVIGLTGQTGAGKSTLREMFAERGVEVIDADVVARDTMEHSKQVLMELVLEFSTEVIHPDATLNRKRLAEICFGDKKKLRRLNEITYPYIIAAIMHKIEAARARGAGMVLLDAPTLFESGLDRRCHRVVAVLADRETRMRRIIERDGLTTEEAERRINAQHDDAFYQARADDILTNDEDLDFLRLSFLELFSRLEQLALAGGLRERGETGAPSGAAEGGAPGDAGALEELTGEESD